MNIHEITRTVFTDEVGQQLLSILGRIYQDTDVKIRREQGFLGAVTIWYYGKPVLAISSDIDITEKQWQAFYELLHRCRLTLLSEVYKLEPDGNEERRRIVHATCEIHDNPHATNWNRSSIEIKTVYEWHPKDTGWVHWCPTVEFAKNVLGRGVDWEYIPKLVRKNLHNIPDITTDETREAFFTRMAEG